MGDPGVVLREFPDPMGWSRSVEEACHAWTMMKQHSFLAKMLGIPRWTPECPKFDRHTSRYPTFSPPPAIEGKA